MIKAEQLPKIFTEIRDRLPKRWGRYTAVVAATFLGSACDSFEGNPFPQPPKNPETTIVTPATQPNATQFESPLDFIAATDEADAASSENVAPTDQVTFLPEVERANEIVFSGHPSEGANFADKGWKTECEWGTKPCGRDQKIMWGGFLKDKSIEDFKDVGIKNINNSRLKFIFEGTGYAKVQIVDSKYGKVFFDKDLKLPCSVTINNKGVYPDGKGSFTGYGTEPVLRPIIDPPASEAEQAIITKLTVENLGPIDPNTPDDDFDAEYESAQ